MNEATARIKINALLEAAGWRFFADGDQPANIRLEPSVTIKASDLDGLGENFENIKKGFIDFLLLDTTTKRRIDTARDLLVGKVPDPKSQVEQITIALIYKFMDDIDAESEEFGGTRTFFAADFARFGWAKLMHSGLGGHEVLNLYAEAITRMPENPGIPPLFRDIFKNAFLPYRDPETLRDFLKVIDEFTYDHSERLGDAFEYLLSVLGSQGDAGQFRTPRHIIDFIVAVIEPKKDDTILDPACGTAGFLISSYKNILKANTDADGHSTLTPDERGRLATNFQGYDISPDMVRLSLVNMYLHGFADPHIFEYDTLTSQDRWNDYADVILANPPFMSPKGGIRPHNRFSVQSKRSEVLFVDYIAEHLTPNGRAGIIVPEGIIFQSQTAYKNLRKLLVEDYLVAVVSLPAGVFHPYSGVKTSILILDKVLAKKADRIAFFKVENDGFDLGAQRRAIDKNDLPQVQKELGEYLGRLRAGETVDDYKPRLGLVVEKARIAEGGEYSLNGERYRGEVRRDSQYPLVELGKVVKILNGYAFKSKNYTSEGIRVIRITNVQKGRIVDNDPKFYPGDTEEPISKYLLKENDLLMSLTGNVGRIGVLQKRLLPAALNQRVACLRPVHERAVPEYISHLLNSDGFEQDCLEHSEGLAQKNLSTVWLSKYAIPLPPLGVQRDIVAEIEGYQKVIDGARAVVENYRSQIVVDPEWSLVELGGIIQGKPKNGYSGKPVPYTTNLKVLSLSATTSGTLDISQHKYLDEDIPLDSPCRCRLGDIYLQRGNTKELVGTAALFDVDESNFVYPDLMIRVRADETKILSQFLLRVLQSDSVREYVTRNAVGAAGSMPKINQRIVEQIPIPLPPLGTQQAVIAEIESERALVNANRELIERFEKKIRGVVGRVWGESQTEARV